MICGAQYKGQLQYHLPAGIPQGILYPEGLL